MKYVILNIRFKFSDGSVGNAKYNGNYITDENSCDNIGQYKKKLKEELKWTKDILGKTIESINLTYEERGDR